MTYIDWSIKGPHFVSCNCDFGCPCQFVALPTHGNCEAMACWRIDEGYFGDTRLDGLYAINTWAWPGAVHHGEGSMQSIIDERADEAQRRALQAILQGEGTEPGATMLTIYRAMCTTVHEPLYKTIELDIDVGNRTARLKVPGLIEAEVESLKNPVTGDEHRARIDLPFGKEFQQAEVGSGSTKATGAIGLEFTDSHAHLVENQITSKGVAV